MAILQRPDLEQPTPDGSTPGLVPVQYAQEIISEATKTSLALSTFRQVRMPTRVSNLPVLDILPQAQFVTGEPDDTGVGGEKPMADQQWRGLVLTAEELSALVVIPEAILEDASIDLWPQIIPRIAESIGAALDAAAFMGTNKPISWPDGIVPQAVAAGNVVVNPAPDAAAYNDAFGLVEDDGFTVNRVYAALNQKANFRGWNAAGIPVYLNSVQDGETSSLYGVPISFDETGALGTTLAVVGDPMKAIIATRVDMQVKILQEATLDLGGGNSVNLAQQDSVALRVRARFGFAVANPVTMVKPDSASRFAFSAITPA